MNEFEERIAFYTLIFFFILISAVVILELVKHKQDLDFSAAFGEECSKISYIKSEQRVKNGK